MKKCAWEKFDKTGVEWKSFEPTSIDEFLEKYRPKQVGQYEEGGKTIKVFEPR